MQNKIYDIHSLAQNLESLKLEGKRIVLCHGCFDLLHIGHIRYFQQAKKMGDVLVSTITPDRFVDKGPGRPVFNEALRADAVASLGAVDYVAINEWPTAVETLEILRPHIYVKGSDFKSIDADGTGKLASEAEACKNIGAELRFTDDMVFSSTNLINRFFSSFSDEVQKYLDTFRDRYPLEYIIECVERMRGLDITLIGDAIIDEYCYGTTLGVSSKYPTIAMQLSSADKFAGGALAIANHLAGFCNSVNLFTVLGENKSHREFIEENLLARVNPHFYMQKGAPTTLKRRFIESYTFAKLLEVYEMNSSGLDLENDLKMTADIQERAKSCDMILVSDFGHGTISAGLKKSLCGSPAFLAVNTQMNAGNKGMNTISKYPRADYVSLSGGELSLDMRESGDMQSLVQKAAKRHNSELFVATLGRSGACGAARNGDVFQTPAFVSRAVDTIGAGDSFLAISAMGVRIGIPHEVSIFLGNVAGGIAVQTLGNQEPITKPALLKYITALLK